MDYLLFSSNRITIIHLLPGTINFFPKTVHFSSKGEEAELQACEMPLFKSSSRVVNMIGETKSVWSYISSSISFPLSTFRSFFLLSGKLWKTVQWRKNYGCPVFFILQIIVWYAFSSICLYAVSESLRYIKMDPNGFCTLDSLTIF